MKKIFPWIVLLITLSLIGIIGIQVSWIRNAVIMKQEQFDQNVLQVLDDVRMELMHDNRMPGTTLQSGKGAGITWFNNNGKGAFPPQIPVAIRFTTEDLQKIIGRHMQERNLEVPFEFAVAQSQTLVTTYEMYSGSFFKQLQDSLHYKMFYTYLGDDQNIMNSLLSMNNNEMLFITVPADSHLFILKSIGWIIAAAILFTLVLITAFSLTIYTMLRQKKLSEIKSDFINNMTHEFKTPLATISLAIDAIGNDKVMGNRDKIQYFTGIIKEENRRMNKQVETILQSALLEKQEIRLNLQEINVHDIIHKSVDNLQLQLQDRKGKIKVQLDAPDPHLYADEVHFSNVISNLLDNALKYSREEPVIRISTYGTKKGLVIVVEDNGIGMSKETVARIFEKFYRAHTGNLHNVKGFGLGLAYVKAIVDAHRGKIRVESIPGKGSRFELEFPRY